MFFIWNSDLAGLACIKQEYSKKKGFYLKLGKTAEIYIIMENDIWTGFVKK